MLKKVNNLVIINLSLILLYALGFCCYESRSIYKYISTWVWEAIGWIHSVNWWYVLWINKSWSQASNIDINSLLWITWVMIFDDEVVTPFPKMRKNILAYIATNYLSNQLLNSGSNVQVLNVEKGHTAHVPASQMNSGMYVRILCQEWNVMFNKCLKRLKSRLL